MEKCKKITTSLEKVKKQGGYSICRYNTLWQVNKKDKYKIYVNNFGRCELIETVCTAEPQG